jgi:hypothetical protein
MQWATTTLSTVIILMIVITWKGQLVSMIYECIGAVLDQPVVDTKLVENVC